MMECELLENCGFFKKYAAVNEKACANYRETYCEGKGPVRKECRRKQYRDAHSAPPPDDMLPNGKMLFS
ncbi:MAG: hypothetical protein Q8J64_01915 [Thermodesulfovibrionales bacterium]|nr:hypothetical protein [Thermodesulfovibrionales bacterium]